MSALLHDLTEEQEQRLKKGVEMFGFKYSPRGFGYDILATDSIRKETIIVGHIEKRKYGKRDYWLEFYGYDRLSEKVKRKTKLILMSCGLDGET